MKHVKGLNELTRKLSKYGRNAEKMTEGYINASSLTMVEQAKTLAKRKKINDTGALVAGINRRKVNKLTYDVFSSERYSAYHEFGTGGEVKIPKGWEDIAIQFKGKGIRTVNIKPRPYFYPSYKIARKQLIKDLQRLKKQKL